jgi:hypothetical protein
VRMEYSLAWAHSCLKVWSSLLYMLSECRETARAAFI